jgi:hypothetical protein
LLRESLRRFQMMRKICQAVHSPLSLLRLKA